MFKVKKKEDWVWNLIKIIMVNLSYPNYPRGRRET